MERKSPVFFAAELLPLPYYPLELIGAPFALSK
jgi:hypothetical protein